MTLLADQFCFRELVVIEDKPVARSGLAKSWRAFGVIVYKRSLVCYDRALP